ncbi:membrane protein [bacterium LRH843]|nr:membrane protein [bacterium LRH843]
MKFIPFLIRFIAFIAGLFTLALGVAFLIVAGLGTATWDVLHIGLAEKTSLSIGAWVQLIGVFMILLACIIERSLPQIGSLLNIIIIGYFLNWILDLQIIPSFDHLFGSAVLFIIGILLMGNGSGMYVATKLGAGPRDGLTIVLAVKTGLSIRLIRTILEGIALLIGWLIGGPVALGTFISVFLIGPVVQAALKFWSKRLERFQVKRSSVTKAAS